MPKQFAVPSHYRSQGIAAIKRFRRLQDQRKRDLSPSIVDFGPVRFKISRHFGFCYGVENAIEIAYRTVRENPGRRIFLVSEMIHNPEVNSDLLSRGVRFLLDTSGEPLISLDTLRPDDIVIVPAFGATLELRADLAARGIDTYAYDTTCPFVEKVWKRSSELGEAGFTVIIHGKRTHEETRATFSQSRQKAPTLVVLDYCEAELLAQYIRGEMSEQRFWELFSENVSKDFDPKRHLRRIGVINQTTMLATETQAIAKLLRDTVAEVYGEANLREHFADTRDTLCYATYENQSATRSLIESGADLALVVGGYNSSNTSHLVELSEERMPTYYIKNAGEILSRTHIRHFDLHQKATRETSPWLPAKDQIEVALTSGASCPDSIVEAVLEKVVSFFAAVRPYDEAFAPFFKPVESAGCATPGA